VCAESFFGVKKRGFVKDVAEKGRGGGKEGRKKRFNPQDHPYFLFIFEKLKGEGEKN